MSSRLVAMVIWAAAAASAVFWGYRLFVKPAAVPPQATVAVAGAPTVGGDLTRLFGAPAPVAPPPTEAAAPADARFKLVGVVAPVAGQRSGLALISVDGKAARAVGIGGVVDGDLAVRSVSHRRVELGPRGGGNTMALELPALPEAARGTLESAAAGAVPMPAPAPPPVPAAPAAPAAPMAGLPPGQAAAPAVPPRTALRRGLPGAVAPNAADPSGTTPPPAPFGVTPQPAPAPGPRPGGMPTS
jgi:general secretion pathway protein C